MGAPIGTTWAPGTWADCWAAGTWADAAPRPTTWASGTTLPPADVQRILWALSWPSNVSRGG